jgi:hypothetical protein
MIKGRSDCRKDIVIVIAEESRQEQAGHRTTIHLYGRKGGKMSDRKKPYVVSQKEGIYYCHMRGYSNIPVFGSVGDKKKAQSICKIMNRSVGA